MFSDAYKAGRLAAEQGRARAPILDPWVHEKLNAPGWKVGDSEVLLKDWLKGYDTHVDYSDGLMWRG